MSPNFVMSFMSGAVILSVSGAGLYGTLYGLMYLSESLLGSGEQGRNVLLALFATPLFMLLAYLVGEAYLYNQRNRRD